MEIGEVSAESIGENGIFRRCLPGPPRSRPEWSADRRGARPSQRTCTAELLPRCAGERIQQEKLIVPELGALPDLESAIPTTYVKGDGQFIPLTNHLAVRALQR